LDARRRDIDVAAYLPHSPLRVYVMGRRGAEREPATDDDLKRMRELAKEAIEVGALGFASSRFSFHKTASGELIPTYDAAQAEIEAIADGVADGGGGLIQFVPDIAAGGYANVLQQVFEAAQDAGLPVTFTLATGNAGDPIWPDAITMIEKYNSVGNPDTAITAQMFPRPIGLVIGLELTGNPFVFYPATGDRASAAGRASRRDAQARSARPHPDRQAAADGHPLLYVAQAWDWIFPLDDDPIYEPDPSTAIAARARARGVTRWRRPTTGCSTTTATPCCWSRWPTSRTTRSTPSGS
jgi:N-acyl-D-amino-acid deacylase